jgi:uncharacterized membrane protein YgdD (TMEM256/DUF423 family)
MQRWMLGLLALAGVLGAAGIAAAAWAAHRSADPDLQIAAYFLLIHATAIASIAAQRRAGFLAAASILATGALLFCGDLVLRALVGTRLFAMAAPTGGILLIIGWLALTAASIRALGRRDAA